MARTVRISNAARADLAAVAAYTALNFGAAQAQRYSAHLRWSIENLANDELPPGTRRRDDLGDNLFSLHTHRTGHPSRHVLLWHQPEGSQRVELLRILHDTQDFSSHRPD